MNQSETINISDVTEGLAHKESRLHSTLKCSVGGLALLAMIVTSPLLAETVTRSAGSCNNLPIFGVHNWVDLENATGSPDGVSSYIEYTQAARGDGIACSGFGFDIPVGSRIDGITITSTEAASASNAVYVGVGPIKPGTALATGGYLGTSLSASTTGPSLWDASWTPSEINDAGFGFRLIPEYVGGVAGAFRTFLDSMQVAVDYTPGLSIRKQFGVDTVAINEPTTLEFTITNPIAEAGLTGIAFTDNMPAGLVVATPNGLSNTCGGSVTANPDSSSVVLTGGTLPTLGSCVISVSVKGTTYGEKNNITGAISSTEMGVGPTSNVAVLNVPQLVFEDGFETTN